MTVHQPIPASGSGRTTTRIAEVWDKGKAAVIVQESVTVDAEGNPLWTARSSIFARGEGGFGGVNVVRRSRLRFRIAKQMRQW